MKLRFPQPDLNEFNPTRSSPYLDEEWSIGNESQISQRKAYIPKTVLRGLLRQVRKLVGYFPRCRRLSRSGPATTSLFML